MRYGVIIAARTGSSRLPGKALLPIKGLPMIAFLIRRLRGTELSGRIILATTRSSEDDYLSVIAEKEGATVFRGDRDDVVKRYVEAAEAFDIEYVVRITGDCPFISGETLDYCLEKCEKWGSFDLATTKSLFPSGIDYEIYNAARMKKICYSEVLDKEEREHLTLHFYRQERQFDIRRVEPPAKWMCRSTKFTVDTEEDYRRAKKLSEPFSDIYFSVAELVERAKKLPGSGKVKDENTRKGKVWHQGSNKQ